MQKLRIGAVSYLNTRPLVHGLQSGPQVQLNFDVPSALAEKLRLAEIDVGLVPIVEYLRGVGEAIVPGICIASDGPVQTVKLWSRVSLEKLTSVAVDSGSRTSVALLRILLAERFGATPDFHSHRADLTTMLRNHEAALLIGDAALATSGAPYIWDLGEGWKDLTGLPFVYATWVIRRGVDATLVNRLLQAAAASGLAHLAEIAGEACATSGQDEPSLRRYLTETLHYTLGAREIAGIVAFQKLCVRYNLVASQRPLVLAAELVPGVVHQSGVSSQPR